MFNLENVFGKKAKKAMMTKEEIAEFIKTNPEALRSFEESYTKHVKNKVSNNFFAVNAKQAVSEKCFLSDFAAENVHLDALVQRIVAELLDSAAVYVWDGADDHVQTFDSLPEDYVPVSNEDLKSVPEGYRPELTGYLYKRDIGEAASGMLLSVYKDFLLCKDPKYILAGEQACKEIEAYIAQRQQDMENTGDQSVQFELTSLNQALMMLEQRTQDLRTAENVAMQSIPMIKTMEFSNYNLVRKINSAFIVTLPVFKQALAQAILLKRQKIQAESIAELDKKTNEMLLKNAQNTVDVSKMTAKMASGSSIQIETLEKTWATITNGIEETRRIQEDARKKREEDKVRLEAIKKEFQNRK